MAWYNSSWLKRKPITLTGGASGSQSAYQTKLTISYESSMKSDFSDLRFTKLDGTTLLDYWIETYTASTSATVWVETDTPANTIEADIYMYYGNAAAASAADMDNTFLFADDFEDSTAGDWTTIQETVTYNSTVQEWGGIQSMCINSSGLSPRTTAAMANSNTIGIQYRLFKTSSGVCYPALHGDGSYAVYTKISANNVMYNDGAWRDTGTNITPATWHLFEIRNFDWTAHTYDIVLDGNVIQAGAGMISTASYNDILHIENSSTGGSLYVDNVISRKFVTDPATYAFGSEESNTGWSNKILGITSPAKVIGVVNASIGKIIGV